VQRWVNCRIAESIGSGGGSGVSNFSFEAITEADYLALSDTEKNDNSILWVIIPG